MKTPRVWCLAASTTAFCVRFILFGQLANAQNVDSIPLIDSFEAQVQLLSSDKLKQIYFVSPRQVLYKCNEQGKVLFEFSNRYLGNLSKIDATDPFDILLYYPDYQTLLFLDRTLNVTADVRLKAEQFPLPTLVALSRDRQVWIYDAGLNTLNRMDRQGNIKSSSQDLSLLLGRRFSPNQLVCNERGVYLVDPEQGILSFDLFAQFQAFLPTVGIEQLQAFDQYLLFRQQGAYYVGETIGTAQALQGLPSDLLLFTGLPNWIVAWDGTKILRFQK
ncbi:hypothetical protein [Haliscomenobacter sp.]|uniref:hypothetical protein n=1 Tax=Haliscomenobacter sp. TaxID=2717303 RepID=UPI0035941F5D